MITEKTYDNGSAKLNYAEGPNTGPPLLFLHGLTDRWQFFQPLLPSLTHRWHVYALDFRGHGKSSRSPPYRYIDHINDVSSFIENVIRSKTFVYGASLGGMISLMVAATRPDALKALIFGDANIKPEYVREVMTNYHTFWSGWEKIAGFEVELDELVRLVADMPIKIPWRPEGKYGDGLNYIEVLNKSLYLKHLDPAVLTPWANGGDNDQVFNDLMTGYDPILLKDIQCPTLLIQGNMELGAILRDDELEYALKTIPNAKHIYLEEYGHTLGCYNYKTGTLLRVINTYLESHL